MVANSSYRKYFIDSSMKIARLYGFGGLDLAWIPGLSSSDMTNMGTLFQNWRTAIESEPRNSSQPQILTARVDYTPKGIRPGSYPTQSMQQYLDWIHVQGTEYYTPQTSNFTGAHAALYNPTGILSADYGINTWIEGGLSANKLILSLPYYGYAWTLVNPDDNGIGAPAIGPAITTDGFMRYSAWIGFDDVEAVKAKVFMPRRRAYGVTMCGKFPTIIIGCFQKLQFFRFLYKLKLLGYNAFQLSNDDNWALSLAASAEKENQENRRRLLLTTFASNCFSFCPNSLHDLLLSKKSNRDKRIVFEAEEA
ncbi:hypothetical protein Pint_14637 [Pistacia integerrima]|uniref:Uncharacterized protein n=1 Tax=Pistacia integerrima TaxID=434235 RepID=A0ACC0YAP8_9ROSI|nr:hypothetical protein Pint_14637 [Pistacia integerrima]